MQMFFVLGDSESKHAFLVTDDDAVPVKYETEALAVAAAKEHCGGMLVLRAVARVTDVTRYNVEKIK